MDRDESGNQSRERESGEDDIAASNGAAADNEARANGIRCCAHLDGS
jgi:hypothetical protein